MITTNNYELYIVDYYDGALNKIQTEELFAFLAGHPDIKEEFDEYENVSITSEAIAFVGKENLKKLVNKSSPLEQQLIAYYENDLSNDEKRMAEKEISENENAQVELEIIRKTKLLPDYTILFRDKQSLKRGGKIIFLRAGIARTVSVAAVILILLLTYFFYSSNKNEQIIANQNNQVKSDSIVVSNKIKSSNKFELAVGTISDKSSSDNKNKKDKFDRKSILSKSNSIVENKSILSNSQKQIPSEINKDSVGHGTDDVNRTLLNSGVANSINKDTGNFNVKNVPQQVNFLAGNGNIMVADLATIFSTDEMIELGIAPKSKANEGEPIKALSFITQKINSAAQTKNIFVAVNDDANLKASTYAFNIGNVFSVSHTRVK